MLKLLVPAIVTAVLVAALLTPDRTHDALRAARHDSPSRTAPWLDDAPAPQLPTSGYIPADRIDPPLPSATTLVPVLAGPPPAERHRDAPRSVDGDRPPRPVPGL